MSTSLIISLGITLSIVGVAAAWLMGPWRRDKHSLRFMAVAVVAPLIGGLATAAADLDVVKNLTLSWLSAIVPVAAGVVIVLALRRAGRL